jgi:hypothetical protein
LALKAQTSAADGSPSTLLERFALRRDITNPTAVPVTTSFQAGRAGPS